MIIFVIIVTIIFVVMSGKGVRSDQSPTLRLAGVLSTDALNECCNSGVGMQSIVLIPDSELQNQCKHMDTGIISVLRYDCVNQAQP